MDAIVIAVDQASGQVSVWTKAGLRAVKTDGVQAEVVGAATANHMVATLRQNQLDNAHAERSTGMRVQFFVVNLER